MRNAVRRAHQTSTEYAVRLNFSSPSAGRSILTEMQTSEASMSKEESVQHRVEVSDVDKDEVEHIAEHEPKVGSQATSWRSQILT